MGEFLNDLWQFMRVRKKYWLLPVVMMMALFGGLVGRIAINAGARRHSLLLLQDAGHVWGLFTQADAAAFLSQLEQVMPGATAMARRDAGGQAVAHALIGVSATDNPASGW